MARMTASIRREDHGWRLPIESIPVTRFLIDYGLTLQFSLVEETFEIRIESTFSVIEADIMHTLVPSSQSALGPALKLFGKVVRTAFASEAGELSIIFEDARFLSIKPDARHEAWEFVGPGGMRAVCAPGGKVSVWQRDTLTAGKRQN
jgi:hypothetical protein